MSIQSYKTEWSLKKLRLYKVEIMGSYKNFMMTLAKLTLSYISLNRLIGWL
jgi:hypothetical protein